MPTLSDFLTRFGASLTERITAKFAILHDPFRDHDPDLDTTLATLRRPCYPAQAEVAKTLAKALFREQQRAVIVCGEMGVGKSTVALATIALSPRPLRTLILCPPHLVPKWKREADTILPDVHVVTLNGSNALATLVTLADAKRGKTLTRPTIPHVYILGRERAKLHHGWQPAFYNQLKHRYDSCTTPPTLITWREPVCIRCGAVFQDQDGGPLSPDELARTRHFCTTCHEPAFGINPSGPRRYAPAEFIKRHLAGVFDLLIADEVHEYKGEDTGQGNSYGALASACRQTIALTGTLLGGYADNLYWLFWRSHARHMVEEGFTYRDVKKWMERYGVLERVTKIRHTASDAATVRGKSTARTSTRRKPGISPLVLGTHLLPTTVFLRLADVADALPPFDERVISLTMSPPLATAYSQLEQALTTSVKQALKAGNRRLLGTYLQALLCYPDEAAFREEVVMDPDSRHHGSPTVLATAPMLGGILPKEEELLALCHDQRNQERRVLVYVTFTNTRDITQRLKALLDHAGFRTSILKSSIAPEKREAWIANQVTQGINVLIANPELVKTGLDLYAFPCFVYYETGYNVYTLRQAARRAWRIGQTQPCEVIYLTYQHTMQEKALTLIATKLEASLALEGELTDSGLAALADTSDSLVLELARTLVGRVNPHGSAEEIWARLRTRELEQNQAITPHRHLPVIPTPTSALRQTHEHALAVTTIDNTPSCAQHINRIHVNTGTLDAPLTRCATNPATHAGEDVKVKKDVITTRQQIIAHPGLKEALLALSFFRGRHTRRPVYKHATGRRALQTISVNREYTTRAKEYIRDARAAGFQGSIRRMLDQNTP